MLCIEIQRQDSTKFDDSGNEIAISVVIQTNVTIFCEIIYKMMGHLHNIQAIVKHISLYQNIPYKITQRKPHWNEHKMHTGLKQTKFREDKKNSCQNIGNCLFQMNDK